MKRREVFEKMAVGAVALAAGSLMSAGPAWAAHRLGPVVHRLDEATDALLRELVESAHHQDDEDEHEANAEVLAVLAAGALNGQARSLHQFLEEENPDVNLRLAARELDRQVLLAERRILTAHVTRDVRLRFQEVQDLMDELVQSTGARRGSRSLEH